MTRLDFHGFLRFCVAGIGCLALDASAATTLVWTGGGTTDNFSDADNWNPAQAPATGDSLTFAGVTRTTPYNDLDPASYTFANIVFSNDNTSGKTAAFTLTGNKLKVSSSILAAKAASGSLVETFDLPVEFTGGGTLGATTSNVKNHGFTFKRAFTGPTSLGLKNTSQYSASIRFEGDITGFDNYYRPNGGANVYFLGNNNAFGGSAGIDFNEGNVRIVDASNLGGMSRVRFGQSGYATAGVLYVTPTNDVTLATKIAVTGPSQTSNGFTIENSTAGKKLTIAGEVCEGGTSGTAGTRLQVQGAGDGVFTGSFTKNRMAFHKAGSGTWTFSDEMSSCALTGLVTVAAGRLVVNTTIPTYRTEVSTGTKLAGYGTLGTADSTVALASGAIYEVMTADNAPAALTIPGTVSLAGNVTVNLTGGAVLAKGSRTTLLTFGAKSGVGVFTLGTGFPEGTILTTGETELYAEVPSDTYEWTGAASGTWNTTDLNWANGLTFSEGTTVLFPDLADATKRAVAIPAAMKPLLATVNAQADRPYVFTGAGGVEGASLLTFVGTATNVWDAPLKDVAQVSVDAGRLDLRGPVSGTGLRVGTNAVLQLEGNLTDGAVTVDLGGTFTQSVTSVIGGSAQLILRAKQTCLGATNTFTGGVTVGENLIKSSANPKAQLIVTSPKALGNDGPVTMNYNSTLTLKVNVAETNRTLNIWGHNTDNKISMPGSQTLDWAGDVKVYEYPYSELFMASSGTFRFGKADGSSVFHMVNNRKTTLVADTVHLHAAFKSDSYLGFRAKLYVYNTNNVWSSFNINVGTAYMMATNALGATARPIKLLQQWNNVQYTSVLNLNGFDQMVSRIDSDYNPKVSNWGYIRSAKPAVLTVVATADSSFNDASTFYVEGKTTLRKTGSAKWTLGCRNTSEGDLIVEAGTLKLAAASSTPTGRESVLRVTDGATVEIADGVTAQIAYAETCDANGKRHSVRRGLYGGPDCTVPGATKVSWMSGTGTLDVLHDISGMVLYFR